MGKRTAGAAGAQDLAEAFKRINAFEVYLVFSTKPLETIPSGEPIQTTYYLSEGRFHWLHVCYVDTERKTYKFWEYACKACEFIEEVAAQSAAGWLVEIVKRIERCEIMNCRQSAIDPVDCLNLLKGQRPTYSKMVAYRIPNLIEAAIELVEIINKESNDWTRCLDRAGRFIVWGNQRFETLTPIIIELLAIMLKKYPEPVALSEFGIYAPDSQAKEAFSKKWKVKRGKDVDGKRNPAVPHDVWQIVQEAGRGKYTLVDPERVTRLKSLKSTKEIKGQNKQKKSPTKSTTGTR